MLLLSNIGTVALRFLLSLLIARLAGAEQMGVYVALTALTFIITRIADAGLPNAVVFFARAHPAGLRKCLSLSLVHGAAMLPVIALLVLGANRIGLANPESSAIIASGWPVLAMVGTTQLVTALITQLLISLEAFKSYGAAVTISPIVTMAICAVHGVDITIQQILVALLTGETCSALLAVVLVLRMTRFHADGTKPSLRSIYTYALKIYVGTSMKAIGQRADRLVLSLLVPNSALAAYAIAMSFRDNAMLPFTSHSMVLRNRLIDAESRHGPSAARALLLSDIVRWGGIAVGLSVLLVAVAPFVVPMLYGVEYRPAVGVLMIIGATLPALAVATLCWTALLSSARPMTVSVGLIATGLVSLAALYIGARLDGVTGASWGALVASIIAAAWWLMATVKK